MAGPDWVLTTGVTPDDLKDSLVSNSVYVGVLRA